MTALLLGLVLPAVAMKVVTMLHTPEQMVQTDIEPEYTISVLGSDGIVAQMELERYVTAVVLAEMPAEFETEALKAQAVVARTYALRRCTLGDKHPQGAVCTDFKCCQAYCTPEEFLMHGGTAEQLQKVCAAVTDTKQQVLLYDGVLIEATFFACSGGSTEDAVAVWGSDIPYLQATNSPGEEAAETYLQTQQFSRSQFAAQLGVPPESLAGNFIGPVTYTRGGGVENAVIGEQTYTGIELRQKLGLNSTAFWITAIGDTITITTRGHGHRVGMSQYGADAMARQGSDYRQILAHYYQNTQLTQWHG